MASTNDQCSVTSPSITVDANDTVNVSWVDDRNANPSNCTGTGLATKAWSHTCGLNVYLRTQNGSYNSTDGGFTAASIKLNNHPSSSPASNANGFFFPYGDGDMTLNPSCFTGSNTFSSWNESINYAGGGANGGLLYFRNNQTGPSSPSLSATGNDANNDINLSWTSVPSATSYKIYRANNVCG